MSQTDGRWVQDGSFPDMQFFIGASEFFDTGSLAARASAGVGLFSLNLASTQAGTFFANLAMTIRTGVYGDVNFDQNQFGTAAGVPGPSLVANTSGPEGITGMPPFTAAQLPTLGVSQRGPVPKGTQIDSIDIIYAVNAVNATVATVGLTKTLYVDNVAPAVTNIIALGANGLATAFRAQPYVKNVAVAAPAMITNTDAEILLNVNLTAGSGGTINFYGVVVKCHYNYN